MLLYHVTTKRNLKKILKEGIKRTFDISAKGRIKRKTPLKTETPYVFLTDLKGAGVIAEHWIRCKRHPVILKVDIPRTWLVKDYWGEYESFGMYRSGYQASEWRSIKQIPIKRIVDIFDFEGC